MIAIANYRAAIAAGWEDRYAGLVVSAHIIAILLGALESKGKWVLVPDPDVTALSQSEVAFLEDFKAIANSGSLICTQLTIPGLRS